MNVLAQITIANIIISLIALIGIFTLTIKEKLLNKIVLGLVALSAGALMGGAFLHLIPEQIEAGKDPQSIMLGILVGFIIFYVIEKALHWRHCHKGNCDVHSFAYINLVGDGVHNFIDGLVIAAAFIVSPALGATTTIAIALHEIPQEIGDFGVLLHGGFNKIKALFLNFLTAALAILGGVIGFFISGAAESVNNFLIPLAAGGFIYIAASDLLPEIKRETHLGKSLSYLSIFIIGILFMYFLK